MICRLCPLHDLDEATGPLASDSSSLMRQLCRGDEGLVRDAAVGAVPTAGFDQWSVKVLISTSDAAIGWVGRERILFGFVASFLVRCFAVLGSFCFGSMALFRQYWPLCFVILEVPFVCFAILEIPVVCTFLFEG